MVENINGEKKTEPILYHFRGSYFGNRYELDCVYEQDARTSL